jgi:hypothetical protein
LRRLWARALQQHLSLEGDHLALLGGAQRAHQRLEDVAAALVLDERAKLALRARANRTQDAWRFGGSRDALSSV